MNSWKKWAVCMIATICIVGGFSCASMSSLLTPARVDKRAVSYADSAGVIDANDFAGYGNLDKANRLKTAVDAAFKVKELSYNQMIEKNQLDYAQLSSVAETNLKSAQSKEEFLFGEGGLLSLGLSMAGFGTLTGLLGLMRKRPGDITTTEMENALAEIKGEVTVKDQQFLQLVKGIQVFLTAHKVEGADDSSAKELKSALNGVQTAETRQAVASAKVTSV